MALGIEEAGELLPQWAQWTIGAFGSLISCWTAGVILLICEVLPVGWTTRGLI